MDGGEHELSFQTGRMTRQEEEDNLYRNPQPPRFGAHKVLNQGANSFGTQLTTSPSRYYFAISHPGVFSLARWS
ncbi:hypothetical protein KY285_010026 [Solanum tuberosum]|nr:hypothetical protein KY285_010026 [Solanum tuberosum]